nr:1-acylglycerol-3-phosphate O-acyltransferase 1 [Molossus molossus]
MELWPGAWTVLLLLFLLLLFLLPTLWFCSPSAKYFFKMAFYNGWILFLAVLAIPVCAVRGRNVENMKILRLMLLHIKYLYGIRVEVRGAHHFPPSQPYVVVSNHQSSLDLLGMMEVLPGRCVPIAKRELLWAGSAGLACWLAGVIFIDRKRTGDAISVMSGFFLRAQETTTAPCCPSNVAPSTLQCRPRYPLSPLSCPPIKTSTAKRSAASLPGDVRSGCCPQCPQKGWHQMTSQLWPTESGTPCSPFSEKSPLMAGVGVTI